MPVFLLYVVTYTVGIFFQAAVIAGATERMRGGDHPGDSRPRRLCWKNHHEPGWRCLGVAALCACVYVASLYRYATDGQATSGFDRALFDQAFVAKKR